MSDSPPLPGGPDPSDGWDLEGLLSGENVWLPEGMRPVAGTLSALRAAPVCAELVGEAAARMAFLQIMLVGGRAVTSRRHTYRRPSRRGRWRPTALAGGAVSAAAAVIIGGIALAGVFSGGHQGQLRNSTTDATTTTESGGVRPGPGGLEGIAAKESAATPTSSSSGGGQSSAGSGAQPERSSLCRQYWEFFAQPESTAKWAAEQGTLQQLSELAGSPWNVSRYCGAYYQWGFAPPPASAPGNNPSAPASQPPGDSPGKNQATEPHSGNGKGGNGKGGNGKGNDGPGNQNEGNGSGNNGNGPSGKGPGSGNQGKH